MNRPPRGAKRDGKGTARRKKPRTPGNGHTDLIRQLWEAAVNLRGSIEPADYKRFVLPIVFLRFLSLRYERRRHELERMVKEPGSEYYTKSAKQAAAILEDPDEYRSVGAFILPKPARWDEIVKHAQADDIKLRLDNALEALEKAYPDKLRGLLPRTYAGSNLARENVTGLINLFSRDIFKEDHGGADLVGRVYEYFIGGFADSEGKRGGEYFTPVSIVRTLVAMLAPEQGRVFDPWCGSGGMFVQSDLFTRHSRRLSFVGQESKDFTYRLCRMNLFIHGLERVQTRERAVRDLVDDSVESQGVVDIFKVAGIERPDISILDDAFLQTFKDRPLADLRLRLLAKLVADEIHARQRRNLAQAKSFKDLLEQTLRRYHNRLIDAAAVIKAMIEIRGEMDSADERAAQLGLDADELAFYDAVAAQREAVYGVEFMRDLIHEVVQVIKRTVKVDWTEPHRDDVKAAVRAAVRRVLRAREVKAEDLEPFMAAVMAQAEALYANWPLAA